MNAKNYYPTLIGACLAVFAACAVVQAGAATSTDASTHDQATSKAAPAKTHHAKKQQSNRAGGNEQAANSQDTPYRSALRRCVEGQAQQRDQCLNDAISRYGHS